MGLAIADYGLHQRDVAVVGSLKKKPWAEVLSSGAPWNHLGEL